MLAERVSLTELGLLPESSGHWPLATWLDHTHAKPAHDALKGLIAAPLSDLAELSARQALLSQLPSISRDIPWTELVAIAAQAGRFLSSNYELIPIPRIERALFAARYGDIVTAVAEQLRAVDALISASRQVYGRLASLPGDARFLEIVAAFAGVVGDTRSGELREAVAGGHTLTIVSLDTMVRGKRVTPERHRDNPVPFREPLQRLVGAVWQLDAFCSLAIASHKVNGVVPTLVPRGAGALELHGLYHPLLPGGVANDVSLATTDRVLFLTGPNMAGKSTLLRAVGIAVYCAHLGMAVPAKAARIPLHDRLMVSITVRDNLQRGESLYLAEIRRVRAIVEAVDRGEAVLAIFDEVFRGTNITDATQATALLIRGLSRAPHGTFIIASHFASVANTFQECSGVGCWCMEVNMDKGAPTFTHRMGRGVSDVQLGMLLLDAEGVGPILRRMAGSAPE